MIKNTYSWVLILQVLLTCIACNYKTNQPQQNNIYATGTKNYEAYNDELTKVKAPEKTIGKNLKKTRLPLIVFLIITLAFTLIYFWTRAKHKQEKLMQTYVTETTIAKKVHDEIANELYNAIIYTSSERILSGPVKEKLVAKLEKIYWQTRNISREINSINVGNEYPEQLKLMLYEYQNHQINIIIKGIGNINWNKISPLKKINIYRVLQELMVNMKKHSQASVVFLNFMQEKNIVKITYSDNGKGMPAEKLSSKNGLLNVENRMDAINGSIIFDLNAGRGFNLTITFPAYRLYVQKNFNYRRH